MAEPLRQEWVAFTKELGFAPKLYGKTAEDFRSLNLKNGMAMVAKYTFPGPDESVQKSEYKTDDSGVRVKAYKADTYKPDLPLLYYIHGGGFVLGSVDEDDRFCDIFAKELGCVVVSVEYRLSPESKHPGPLVDCVEGAKWAIEHAESLGAKAGPIAIAGKSAGGGLALGTALRLIDDGRGKDVLGVAACQPVTVHPQALPSEFKNRYTAYDENAENTVNTKAAMLGFYDLHDAPKDDPYIFSLNHKNLKALPKVYMNACGADTLRDDARLLKDLLDKHGVPNEYDEYAKLPHYFYAFPSSHLDALKKEYFEKTVNGISWILTG